MTSHILHGSGELFGMALSPGPYEDLLGSTAVFRCAPVKLDNSWVKVPLVELDGSRLKHSVREEAVRPNHKRDIDGTLRSAPAEVKDAFSQKRGRSLISDSAQRLRHVRSL